MPSREELLQGIQPGMKLTKDFFLRIYGYEITYPGYAAMALEKLEAIGCSRAQEYYRAFTVEYETRMDAELKEAAVWYRQECEKRRKTNQKVGEEQRKQEILEDLLQRSDKELLNLLQQLS